MSRKTGRNQLCPCGSGLKYKHCHGAENRDRERLVRQAYRENAQATRHLVHRLKQKQITLAEFDDALKSLIPMFGGFCTLADVSQSLSKM
ncbi:MAG: SEC-C domain-containing protein [Planctomycetota bacterium]|nr:SEC-C domain-containing protein [Planctomycetota bacterium]